MTTTNEEPEAPGSWAHNPLSGFRVEHTFEAPHVFRLWDTLTEVILRHARNMNRACAQDIARGLITDTLIDLPELNRAALAACPDQIDDRDLCTNASCDGPKQGHRHGNQCGPLCACGDGE